MKNYNTALITGGCQRIGFSIVKYLASRGFNIVVQYNNSSKEIKKIERISKKFNVKFHSFKFDFENLENLEESYKHITKKIGRIDILINNASAFDYDSLDTSDFKIFDRHINVNLKAPLFLSQAAAPALTSRKGAIVNIIDIHAELPLQGHLVYNAAKGGLLALTRSLARELAPAVRVNGVSPGPILWPESETWKDMEERQRIVDHTLLRRCGEPEDIAQAVEFLLTAPYVTGQILAVDGGRSIAIA